MFGREDEVDIVMLTHDHMVRNGKLFQDCLESGTKFTGLKGITRPPFSCIPVDNHMDPNLHIGLGLLCDGVNRMERFIYAKVYSYDERELLNMNRKTEIEVQLGNLSQEIKNCDEARNMYYKWSLQLKPVSDKSLNEEISNEKRDVLINRNECITEIKRLENLLYYLV